MEDVSLSPPLTAAPSLYIFRFSVSNRERETLYVFGEIRSHLRVISLPESASPKMISMMNAFLEIVFTPKTCHSNPHQNDVNV